MLVPVRDAADPRLADYVSLTDVALRSRHEPEQGLFIAESLEVLRRAIAAGCAPRSFLLDAVRVDEAADVLAAFPDVPTYVADQDLLRAVTGFRVHRGVLAAMHRPAPLGVAALLDALPAGRSRMVVLEDLVDHTNVGAAFRSVAALGADAVVVAPRCADPLYRRSVRVSMGTVFQVPWTRTGPWPQDLGTLREAGFVVAALALDDGAISLDELAEDPPEYLAVVLGTEGDGLSRRTVAEADLVVRIPMAAGVDSLNVAAACAVTGWALRRRPVAPTRSLADPPDEPATGSSAPG